MEKIIFLIFKNFYQIVWCMFTESFFKVFKGGESNVNNEKKTSSELLEKVCIRLCFPDRKL